MHPTGICEDLAELLMVVLRKILGEDNEVRPEGDSSVGRLGPKTNLANAVVEVPCRQAHCYCPQTHCRRTMYVIMLTGTFASPRRQRSAYHGSSRPKKSGATWMQFQHS